MRRVKGKDTAPELTVRKALTALGARYRLHRADLPGKPDIVISGRRGNSNWVVMVGEVGKKGLSNLGRETTVIDLTRSEIKISSCPKTRTPPRSTSGRIS